jgi:hypothetical protein
MSETTRNDDGSYTTVTKGLSFDRVDTVSFEPMSITDNVSIVNLGNVIVGDTLALGFLNLEILDVERGKKQTTLMYRQEHRERTGEVTETEHVTRLVSVVSHLTLLNGSYIPIRNR